MPHPDWKESAEHYPQPSPDQMAHDVKAVIQAEPVELPEDVLHSVPVKWEENVQPDRVEPCSVPGGQKKDVTHTATEKLVEPLSVPAGQTERVTQAETEKSAELWSVPAGQTERMTQAETEKFAEPRSVPAGQIEPEKTVVPRSNLECLQLYTHHKIATGVHC